jgi:ABC-type glutathione transport system ATPase component
VTEPILATEGLRKEFHSPGHAPFVAVDDVGFAVMPGRSLGVVGESGSGKTTVARMICGLERPTAGTIVVARRDRSHPTRRTAERRRRGRELQIVLQDPYTSLDPHQTVNASLQEVLRVHFDLSAAQRRARVMELLDAVGLDTRVANAVPRAMSGGQRQRVAIARALAAEPQLILLDEAVSALDVSIQAQILNLLADLRQQAGVAYLFISHNLAVIRQICDEAVVMHRGRIVERGSVDELLDSPRDAYTRRLRASVPGRGWRPSRTTTTAGAA